MNVIDKFITRSVLGLFAGAGIGLLLVALFDEWITTWSDNWGFDRLQLAWTIWATVAITVLIFALIFGGTSLSKHYTLIAKGMISGCLAGIAITLLAARINNDWPFVIKGAGTSFFVGIYVVLPLATLLGGLMGRRISRREDGSQKID